VQTLAHAVYFCLCSPQATHTSLKRLRLPLLPGNAFFYDVDSPGVTYALSAAPRAPTLRRSIGIITHPLPALQQTFS